MTFLEIRGLNRSYFHRIENLLEDAKPICVITNMEGSGDDFPPNTRILSFQTLQERSLNFSESNLELEKKAEAESIFAVMYTSGKSLKL